MNNSQWDNLLVNDVKRIKDLKRQGAIDVLEELHMDIYAMAWNKKDVLKLIIKRIKELKECERINE